MAVIIVDLTGAPVSAERGASSLVAAATWVQELLLGPAATMVAVIAVASIGYLMLAGRIDVQRGITVVLGCFILFGAPVIALGLQQISGGVGDPSATAEIPKVATETPAPPLPSAAPSAGPATTYDPYAGASAQ